VAPKTNCKGSAERLINGQLTGDIAPGDADHLQDFLESQIRSVGYGYDGDGTMVTVLMAGEGGRTAGN
jgi:hypothetical protein